MRLLFRPLAALVVLLLLSNQFAVSAGAQSAPVTLIQVSDGTLYLAQSGNAWTMLPTPIADADLEALTQYGELDGTIWISGLGLTTPGLAAAPTPGQASVVPSGPTPSAVRAADLAGRWKATSVTPAGSIYTGNAQIVPIPTDLKMTWSSATSASVVFTTWVFLGTISGRHISWDGTSQSNSSTHVETVVSADGTRIESVQTQDDSQWTFTVVRQ